MNWISYILQSNLYLIIFFGFYWLLLRHETFNNYNRAYLVISALVSFGIPLWNLEIMQTWFITQKTNEVITTFTTQSFRFVNQAPKNETDHLEYLSIIYLLICLLFALKLVANFFNLYKFLKGSEHLNKAFTFFNKIVIATGLDPDEVILNHEQVHAKHFHSIDVIIFEIIGIFCWFNPIVYAYKRAIKNIHEFIADEIASKSMSSKAEYAMLLFSEKFQTHPSVLVSNFFTKTSLKLRIEMLNKNRSNKTAILKYGLIAPMFLGMMVFASANLNANKLSVIIDKIKDDTIIISGKIISEDEDRPLPGVNVVIKNKTSGTTTDINGNFKIKADKNAVIVLSYVGYESIEVNTGEKESNMAILMRKKLAALNEIVVTAISPNTKKQIENITEKEINFNDSEIFSVVEQNAEYPDGVAALNRYLAKNLRYPKEAHRNNVQGKVFTKFLIDAKGEISNIRILKGMGSGLDEETVRVISKMPNWIPAKQNGVAVNSEFALPVSFVIEEGEVPPSPKAIILNEMPDNALYILNGKPSTKEEFLRIGPNNIESVDVSKNEKAIEKFGHEGRYGAIEMKTKNYDDTKFVFEKTPIYFLNGKEISLEKVKELKEENILSISILTKMDAIDKYGEKGKDGVVEIILK